MTHGQTMTSISSAYFDFPKSPAGPSLHVLLALVIYARLASLASLLHVSPKPDAKTELHLHGSKLPFPEDILGFPTQGPNRDDFCLAGFSLRPAYGLQAHSRAATWLEVQFSLAGMCAWMSLAAFPRVRIRITDATLDGDSDVFDATETFDPTVLPNLPDILVAAPRPCAA
ncbi:hypothetical protein R3P38DRAFT_3215599 [Favolaschia claudopus]|uniref:Uncharacterized protein n=1 Tax=Favolaschia claudopus TaxID=2862362 RepID=A0AAW0A8C4_9AGAR